MVDHTIDNLKQTNSEQWDVARPPEILPEGEAVYGQLEAILNDQVMNQEMVCLEEELSSPDYQAVIDDMEALDGLQTELVRGGDADTRRVVQLDQAITEIRDRLASDPRYEDYLHILNSLASIDRLDKLVLPPDSDIARSLISAVSVDPRAERDSSAPFAKYQANNSEAWQFVSNSEITDYIKTRPFFDTNSLADGYSASISQVEGDMPFEINSSLFVFAQGFSSWVGRGENGQAVKEVSSPGYGQITNSISIDTMKHYASLPSDLPPVSGVRIFVQPNGRMFADNGSGDSHRLGAALLRGDRSIKTNNVVFYKLDRNILD